MGKYTVKCIIPDCPYVQSKRHFFSFPNNKERRIAWFEAVNNNIDIKIPYSDERMHICENHFKDEDFSNSKKTRLSKFAIPSVFEKLPSDSNIRLSTPHSDDIDHQPSTSKQIPESVFTDIACVSAETKKNVSKPKFGILKSLHCHRVSELSPRKKLLYKFHRNQKVISCKLRSKLQKAKNKLKCAYQLSNSKLFCDLEKNFDPAGVDFIKSQFVNAKRHKPRWTTQNKVFALALYKKGPRCYTFFQKFIKLPSKSTLQKFLQKIPFKTGINDSFLQRLKIRVSKFNPDDRVISLIFDEIALSQNLTYSRCDDEIVGYLDLGSLGRQNILANHALVFMIQGIRKNWKQPFTYYFTKDTISSSSLKCLVVETITALQSIGLRVLCTICDQGVTNRTAIKMLIEEKIIDKTEPYFICNNQKIFTLFDTPHLLKSTRNALEKYNIRYENTKIAKFRHIQQAYEIDRTKRFHCLHKLRRSHLGFGLNSNRLQKMKVSIAAKIFSNTVAATIETLCSCSTVLPAEAIYTAEFVSDMNNLFDSLNSNTIYPSLGQKYKCCINKKNYLQYFSNFWNVMLEKISNWGFILRDNENTVKTKMPFKQGWLNNIRAVKGIWEVCEKEGFQFLRTRALNQDSIENLFACIRQYGAANTNPTCFQFISALKTSVLNNLILKTKSGNCENDDCSLLDNLRDFLTYQDVLAKPLICDEDNELLILEIPEFDYSSLNEGNFDVQALSYVCGFLTKKLEKKSLLCDICRQSLLLSDVQPQHTFVFFKEYSDEKKLKYVTEDLIIYIAKVFDITMLCLAEYGYVKNIFEKLKYLIIGSIDFTWFKCILHSKEIQVNLLDNSIFLIANKYFEAKKDQSTSHKINKKMKKITHV